MTRDRDPPQTVGEAATCGWRWITVECRGCRHRGEVKLGDLLPAMRLSTFARKLTCRGCRGRRAYVSLGTYVQGAAGQPWADHRRLAFEGDRAIQPPRD